MTKKSETAETAEKDEVESAVVESAAFDKRQLIKSKRYQQYRDLLTVLLKDNVQYTHEEIGTIINNFMKGKVK